MCICDTLEPRYNKHAYNEFPRYNESKIWPLVYFSNVIDHAYNEFLVITNEIWRSPETSLYRGSSVMGKTYMLCHQGYYSFHVIKKESSHKAISMTCHSSSNWLRNHDK